MLIFGVSLNFIALFWFFSVSLNFAALFHCVDVVGIVWGCIALLLVCV